MSKTKMTIPMARVIKIRIYALDTMVRSLSHNIVLCVLRFPRERRNKRFEARVAPQ